MHVVPDDFDYIPPSQIILSVTVARGQCRYGNTYKRPSDWLRLKNDTLKKDPTQVNDHTSEIPPQTVGMTPPLSKNHYQCGVQWRR